MTQIPIGGGRAAPGRSRSFSFRSPAWSTTGLPCPPLALLVLNDYHLVRAQAVQDAVSFLLEHLPPALHLVIASREDPHCPCRGFHPASPPSGGRAPPATPPS